MFGQKLKNITFFPSQRHIHSPLYFAEGKADRLVIVGNNSMLFATLNSLKHHGSKQYPPITFIYPAFWLDNIHKDYYDLNWGQTVYGLPKIVRDMFFKYRPNYPQDTFIRWHEYQEIRNKSLEELFNNFHIESHKKEPKTITKSKSEQWIINFGFNDSIEVPKNSFFYGWYRKHLLTHGISNTHTKLYTLPRNEVPNPMFIIGHGLSLVWLLKHFPEHEIINFKKPDEQTPNVPANKDVSVDQEIKKGRLKIYTSDKYEAVTNETGQIGNIVNIKTGEVVFSSGIPIFAATGLMPEHNIFKLLPEEQKILMPIFDQNGELIAPKDEATKELIKDIFTAPKNTPLGSLPQSYIYLMNLTNNMRWTSEPMFYYSQNQAECLKNNAKNFGIELHINFFDAIDEKVMALENALGYEQSITLYLDVFKTIYSPTDIEELKFKECLQNTFKPDNKHKQQDISKYFKLGVK